MTNTGRPVVEEISSAFSTDVCFVCAGRIPDGNIKNANTQAVNFMTELTAGLQGVNRWEPNCKHGAANDTATQMVDYNQTVDRNMLKFPENRNPSLPWILATVTMWCTSFEIESSIAAIVLTITRLKMDAEAYSLRRKSFDR